MPGVVMEVSGHVTNVERTLPSGDPYPPDLRDAPAVYRITALVRESDGSKVERIISYTAYPPSPVADAQREKIRLSFHERTVRVGHQIWARGTLNPQTNTITVADQGDFIETSRIR
jgi:hypothetical protein